MKQLHNTKPLSFDVYVLACDGIAFAVGEKSIMRGQYKEVETFVREEMIAVCHCEEPAIMEIKDKDGKIVHPFVIKGRHLLLSPCFFNKGYELWIEDQKILDLSVDYWCSYVGDTEYLMN